MSVSKGSSVSRDFPLFHTDLIPTYVCTDKREHSYKPSKNKFTITNEHPDFLKLDGMKEEGYRNPYLDEIVKVDRSECYKLIDTSRRQLNLINFINSNPRYNQNPNILKYITNAEKKEINRKREQVIKEKIKIKERNLTQEYESINNQPKRDRILNSLKNYIPKLDYKMGRTIDYSKPLQTEYQVDNRLYSLRNGIKPKKDGMLKKYNFFFDSKKSAYLKNFNDYKISEAQQRDLEKGLVYQRKPSLKYNIFKRSNDIVSPPPFRGESWGSFHENFYTIENNRNQFRIKGGLFSEFSDKNKNVISLNKRELREKIQKEMDLRKSLKNNNIKLESINNSNNNNAFLHK